MVGGRVVFRGGREEGVVAGAEQAVEDVDQERDEDDRRDDAWG